MDVVTRFFGDELERAVQAREVDLGFGGRFQALSGVATQKVGDEEMLVLLRRGHPALRTPLTARKYAALDHVLVAPRGLG